MEREFFLLLAVVATGSGLLVVIAKNPIHSALALVATHKKRIMKRIG